jgi:SM-20-related protein
VFYGLLEDPRTHGHGLAVEGEPGLLLAFRPDLLHEVTPVLHGDRYTIVTWLAE